MRGLVLIYILLPWMMSGQEVTTLTAPFNGSGGVTLGPDGQIYIADFGTSLNQADGRVVWQYNHEDSLRIFATGLSGASGNDFDQEGNLIQSNIASSIISSISPQGRVSFLTNRFVNGPVGVLVRDNGDIIICNCNGNNMLKYSSNGNTSVLATGQGLFCPNGITGADDGNMYISNFSNGKVLKMDPSGRITELVELPGRNNGHLTFANGVLYVCSHGASQIFEVQLDGSYRILAGSGIRGNNDGEAGVAQFSRPNGIAASITGDTLYINSSVPITDAGGRPLNPSLLRMITGVRDFTLNTSNLENGWNISILNSRSDKTKLVVQSPAADLLDIKWIDINGKIISSESAGISSSNNEIEIVNPQYSGVLFLNVTRKSDGATRTFKLMRS